MKSFIKKLYQYSEYIVNYSFYTYFIIYSVGVLFRKSIIYNYLFILLLGLFLGYRLARKACDYLEENQEELNE